MKSAPLDSSGKKAYSPSKVSNRFVAGLFLALLVISGIQLVFSSFGSASKIGSYLQVAFEAGDLEGLSGPNQAIQNRSIAEGYKPLFASENYHRCQDKLGTVALTLSPENSRYSDVRFRKNLGVLFSRGVKYVVINIDNLTVPEPKSSIVEETKLAILAARENFVTPIINIRTTAFFDWASDLDAMSTFYRLISENGNPFIATTVPDAILDVPSVDSLDVTRAMRIANPLAIALSEYDNILIGSPNLRLDPVKDADQLEYFLNNSPDTSPFTNGDNSGIGVGPNGTFQYDVMLFTITNRDSDFKNLNSQNTLGGVSEYEQTGHWLYSDPMGGQRFTAKQMIRDRNRSPSAIREFTNSSGDTGVISAIPNVQAIIMGFTYEGGTLPNDLNQATLERLTYDYTRFSDDPTVKAIVLAPTLESKIQRYAREGKIDVTKAEFMKRLNKAGTNCNYDLVLSDYEYDEKAKAGSCEMREDENNGNRDVQGRVVCIPKADGHLCQVNIKSTLQIGFPVRFCGSTTPFGTDTKPFKPYAISVADDLHSSTYDVYNQFGSPVTFSSSDIPYMMPWLGSCINNAGQLQKIYDYSNTANVNNAALWQNTSDELEKEQLIIEQDAFDNLSPEAFGPLSRDEQIEYLDEMVVFLGSRVGFHKNSAVLEQLRTYDSRVVNRRSSQPNACNGRVQYTSVDPQNMIYGTELIIDEAGWEGSGSEMCYELAIGGSLDSQVPFRAFCSDTTQGNCACDSWADIPFGPPQSGPAPLITLENIEGPLRCRSGNIARINRCLSFDADASAVTMRRLGSPNLMQYAESPVIFRSNQPSAPAELEIEGVYDALAESYKRLQRNLSDRNLKMIFNEKRGWEANAIIRSYINVPVAEPKFRVQDGRKNKMLSGVNLRRVNGPAGTSSESTSGSVTGNGGSCKIGVNFASFVGLNQGEIDKAKGIGYGYGQLIINDAGQAASPIAIGQFNSMCGGMTPIVRSCVTGQCGFADSPSGGSDLGAALAQLSKSVSCGAEGYYVCGHNEPISEYGNGMVAEGAWSSACVAAFKANGGVGNLTTPIFNGTFNDGNTTFVQNISSFVSGFGGSTAVNSSFVCTAINVYEAGGSTVSGFLDQLGPTGLSLPYCVNETGLAPGDSSPEKNAAVAVELQNRSDVLFALGFNWTNSNPGWSDFAPSDCGKLALENACGIPQSDIECSGGTGEGSDGSGSTGSGSGKPADYFEYYANHLAEGDNRNEYSYYFEALYYLDEVARLLDIYSTGNDLDSITFEETGELTGWNKSGVSEHYASIFTCDDLENDPDLIELVRELRVISGDPEYLPNCISSSVVPGASQYRSDPLGQFLCNKGYDLGVECEQLCVGVPGSDYEGEAFQSSSGSSLIVSSPSISSISVSAEDVNQSNILLYPVGRDLEVPSCQEPSSLRAVRTDIPYYAGGLSQTNYPFQLTPGAASAFEELISAMPEQTRNTCAINWGYRSSVLQGSFGNCGRPDVACACHSEHQLGTTVDFIDRNGNSVVNFDGTACENWLTANASNYGWVRSYKPNNPDYSAEPWHWRWLPGRHAIEFKENEDEFDHLKYYLLSLAGVDLSSLENSTVEPEQSSSSVVPATTGFVEINGGAAVTASVDKFIGTRRYSSSTRIDAAAEEYSLDVATNANFMAASLNGPKAEWLWAGGGSLGINPADRFLTHALVTHNGAFSTGEDLGGGIKVDSANEKLAIIDIKNWYQNIGSINTSVELGRFRGKIGAAVTGVPPLVLNGVSLSASEISRSFTSANWSAKDPRTIIGWSGNQVTLITLPRANIYDMVDAARDLGLENAVGLDGGGSTQMYFKDGVPEELSSHENNSIPETVYWPSRQGASENGPRFRDFYIGFTDLAIDERPSTPGICERYGSSELCSIIGELALLHPLKDLAAPISNRFGQGGHKGIDYEVVEGTPVFASAPGIVDFVNLPGNCTRAGYSDEASWWEDCAPGNYVRLKHTTSEGVQFWTNYMHLNIASVRQGDIVSIGQKVGEVGSTGNSTGNHLHFELWINSVNSPYNPAPYLNGSAPEVLCGSNVSGNSIETENVGMLTCSIETTNTSDRIDWSSKGQYIWDFYLKWYNLDNIPSYSWVGHSDLRLPAESQPLMMNWLGSQLAIDRDNSMRARVTSAIEERAIELGVNPHLVITIWLEETAASAVGDATMGCGIDRGTIPSGLSEEEMVLILTQQVDCIASVIDRYSDFSSFMCTYSGEQGWPRCEQFTANPNFPVNICRIYNELG